jgi:hypothetical protein
MVMFQYDLGRDMRWFLTLATEAVSRLHDDDPLLTKQHLM